jgi:hypothetical protein
LFDSNLGEVRKSVIILNLGRYNNNYSVLVSHDLFGVRRHIVASLLSPSKLARLLNLLQDLLARDA